MPGADPQTMASSVATPLEEQFGQIPGITQMTSSSALGFTQISLQFDLSRTVDSAATDTLAAINAAGGQLPPAMIYPPTIRKVNPADTPILVLAVTSDSLPLTVVDAYAENILLPKISQISGVGLVGIGGQQKPAIRVQVDPQALAARGIGLEDVRTVLSQANVDLPKGTLNSPRQTYTLNTNDQLLNPKAYNELIVAYRNGVARAHPGHRQGDRRSGKRPAGRLVQSESRGASWAFNASPAPMSSPRSIASRPCCRSWRPPSRRPSRCRSSPTAPRPSAPRSAMSSSR